MSTGYPTADMTVTEPEGPAIAHYLEQQRITNARTAILEVLRRCRAVDITEDQASRILLAAGIGLTPLDVRNGVAFMDDAEHRHLRHIAQGDLDALVHTAAHECTPVDSLGAVLAVVGVLVDAA